MKRVYLDNAATTPLFGEVIEVMADTLKNVYGNPSSTHYYGRCAKTLIEEIRKQIARYLNVISSEIIFTASGTEANNFLLMNAVKNLEVKHLISTQIEHHAVGHVLEDLRKTYGVKLSYVNLDAQGNIDFEHLQTLIAKNNEKALVSLTSINNEIGNLLDLKRTSDICQQYGALFHSDTVQAIGHYRLDLQEIPIDFITASAHKFHGPKGVGFAYLKKGYKATPMILGGGQEKGLRAGTENVANIVGMGKALELSVKDLESDIEKVKQTKSYCIKSLKENIPNVAFNGTSEALEKSSPFVLSVRLPVGNPMLKFQLDMRGIAVSSGSACQSGSTAGSHVLNALKVDEENTTTLRMSFSKFTTKEDIDYTVAELKKIL